MKDDEIRSKLRKLIAPEASESARARARHRALTALQQGDSRQPEDSVRQGFGWWWRGAIALALVMGVLPFFFFKHQAASENVATDRELLQQVEKLFPHQVNAVVEENGKVDLAIAESPVVGSDQPVLVVFNQGGQTIRVLSYSGHHICVVLGGAKSCFDILSTPAGGIILESEDKVWVASEHPSVDGYTVRAQTLEASL